MICVSVVIPTFKRPDLLTRCLKAIYDQNFDKRYFEVIVVSDGPDPATEKVIFEMSSFDLNFQLKSNHLPEKRGLPLLETSAGKMLREI
nr:glycosyltransferase [Dyadobacter sp. NIV53]